MIQLFYAFHSPLPKLQPGEGFFASGEGSSDVRCSLASLLETGNEASVLWLGLFSICHAVVCDTLSLEGLCRGVLTVIVASRSSARPLISQQALLHIGSADIMRDLSACEIVAVYRPWCLRGEDTRETTRDRQQGHF